MKRLTSADQLQLNATIRSYDKQKKHYRTGWVDEFPYGHIEPVVVIYWIKAKTSRCYTIASLLASNQNRQRNWYIY